MAYQAKQRDPLLDQRIAAAIERRGREMVGLGLLAVGLALAVMLGSYSADDPSWLSPASGPIENWLGRTGAGIASPLMMIAGKGSYALAFLVIAWGLRMTFHVGEERWTRGLFAPLVVVVASAYAATDVPHADWGHAFGMGGLFGDTVLGALMSGLPIGTGGLRMLALSLAVALIFGLTYASGLARSEARLMGRFMLVGVILSYAQVMKLLGRGAAGALRGAGAAHAKMREVRAARAEAAAAAGPKPSLVQRVAGGAAGAINGLRGAAERAREITAPVDYADEEDEALVYEGPDEEEWNYAPSEDRVRARINRAVDATGRPRPVLVSGKPGARAEPPVTAQAAPAYREVPADDEPLIEEEAETRTVVGAAVAAAALARRAPLRVDAAPEPVPAARVAPEIAPRITFGAPTPAAEPAPQRAAAPAPKPAPTLPAPSQVECPPLELLTDPSGIPRHELPDHVLEENARRLEEVLGDYGVKGEIVSVRPGPVVTMYELEPAAGVKASRVIGLADDIARSMAALSARVSTVPGRSVIGIELPNADREMVVLREILDQPEFAADKVRLPLALGKDIGGDPIVANLAKMPHLLIAGTTGSGKSVAINTMILSLLYRCTPEECRLIMIDPKMLELSVYDGIPHLLSPVVTDPKKAVVALKWTVAEMERRYRKMSELNVRNIENYNGKVREKIANGDSFEKTIQTGFDEETGDPVFETHSVEPEIFPYIVVVVDEMADLMMVAGKEIEACIQRLAQMARASGIHIIMATQRPSVDVITGTIKANFPTRISFQVTSKIDSRTILGEQGAEQLLGMGDMLYMAGGAKITRVHGPFCSDEEVEEIVRYLKQFGPPQYESGVLEGPEEASAGETSIDEVLGLGGGDKTGDEALYDQAVHIAAKDRKCSTSYIQRKLGIGYNKAARLVEQMEEEGVVSSANHVGKREVLVPEVQG